MTEGSTEDLCRCCHSEGSFHSLYTPYKKIETVNSHKKTKAKKENKIDEVLMYSDVLRECFNIELLAMPESWQNVLCTICYTCIQRLEDAVKFKQQIEKCEKRFREVYSGCVSKDSTEVTIKEEPLEYKENIVLEVSFDNGASDDNNKVPDDGNYADDNKDMDLQLDDEDNSLSNNVNSEEITTTADNVNKEKLEMRPKPVQDVELLEGIEGIKVVKRHIHYEETDGRFQCLKCPLTANTHNAIRTHIRCIHFNIPKYKCGICSQHFATLITFNEHKLGEHNIDDRFKCDACDKTFHTKGHLVTHKNVSHKLGKKMKCKVCEFETYEKRRASQHMRCHSNERNFKCCYCKKAFKIKETMRMHEKIHTGEKRKLCAECGQAFVQRASLKYHMIKHHPGVDF